MDKKAVVHIHNGISLSYLKERIWINSTEVDGIGAYYTEWSKFERESQILYIYAYVRNLERLYWQSYMQGNKGDIDVKNRFLDSVGEAECGMIWENSTEACILPYMK